VSFVAHSSDIAINDDCGQGPNVSSRCESLMSLDVCVRNLAHDVNESVRLKDYF